MGRSFAKKRNSLIEIIDKLVGKFSSKPHFFFKAHFLRVLKGSKFRSWASGARET